jgi:hypothetical protein
VDAFFADLREGLETSLANPARIHGWHVQGMFGEVLRALGHCALIKEEDQGSAWSSGGVVLPDYRIVLPEGENLVIEVKNHHAPIQRPFRMAYSRLEALQRYAGLVKARPMFAVFFSRMGHWTLVDPSRFTKVGNRAVLEFAEALIENEMALVGDLTIGTRPPLVLSLRIDQETSEFARNEDGTRSGVVTIRGVEVRSGEEMLVDPDDQALAMYLMMFGRWEERMDSIFNGDRLVSVDFFHEPVEWDERQCFAFVGSLSEFYSREFFLQTMPDGTIQRLAAELDSGESGFRLAQRHPSGRLPLWRFKLQPRTPPTPATRDPSHDGQ